MADELPVLDYGPPVRRRGLLRTLAVVALIAIGAAVGAAVGDWVQPDLYIFNGWLSFAPSGAGTDMAVVK